KQHPNKTFLLFENNEKDVTELTYAEFMQRVNKFSNVLLEMGVNKGDKVTLHLPNSSDFIVAWFSLATIGAIMVPTNILSTGKEMGYLINNSESILLITEEEYLDKFTSIKEQIPNLKHTLLARCTNDAYEHMSVNHLIEKESDHQPEINISEEDVVSIRSEEH